MSNAADRVREFLDQRSVMRGLDPQEIHQANLAKLTVRDLQVLVQQAEALRHSAPHAAQIIEAGVPE